MINKGDLPYLSDRDKECALATSRLPGQIGPHIAAGHNSPSDNNDDDKGICINFSKVASADGENPSNPPFPSLFILHLAEKMAEKGAE